MNWETEINNSELMHYGVQGMKWGIRKARKQGVAYTYKSHGQKKYEERLKAQKKAGADAKKIAKTQKKLDIYKARDVNRQDYASRANAGKSVAKMLLMGPLGSGNYSRMRSAGSGRLGAFLVSNWVSATVGAPLAYAYTRHRETSAAKRDIRKRDISTRR